jgi:hypothetical protein
VFTLPDAITEPVPSRLSVNIAPRSVYESFLLRVILPLPLRAIVGIVVSTTVIVLVICDEIFPELSV